MIAIYGRVDPAHFVTASPSSSSIVFSNPTMTQGSLSSIQSNPFSPSYLPTEMTAATPQPTDAPTILPHSPTFRESSHPTNMRSFLSSTMPSWNLNPNPPMSILEQSSGPLISSSTSALPSKQPSFQPSHFPTDYPSKLPSYFPTDSPSTTQTSQYPSFIPSSTRPSDIPSSFQIGRAHV